MKRDIDIFRDSIQQARKENTSLLESAAKKELKQVEDMDALRRYYAGGWRFISTILKRQNETQVLHAVEEATRKIVFELTGAMKATTDKLNNSKRAYADLENEFRRMMQGNNAVICLWWLNVRPHQSKKQRRSSAG